MGAHSPPGHMLLRELLDGAGNCSCRDLSAVIRGAPAPGCLTTNPSSPREDLWRFRCSFPSVVGNAPLATAVPRALCGVRFRNTCPTGWRVANEADVAIQPIPASRPGGISCSEPL